MGLRGNLIELRGSDLWVFCFDLLAKALLVFERQHDPVEVLASLDIPFRNPQRGTQFLHLQWNRRIGGGVIKDRGVENGRELVLGGLGERLVLGKGDQLAIRKVRQLAGSKNRQLWAEVR